MYWSKKDFKPYFFILKARFQSLFAKVKVLEASKGNFGFHTPKPYSFPTTCPLVDFIGVPI